MTTETELPAIGKAQDPRELAFFSPASFDVFRSVVQENEITSYDPLDVHDIHERTRDVFYKMVDRVRSKSAPKSGQTLLLRGEAGSGKSHLMRYFRNYVHENRFGFCAYLQMTTEIDDYLRYILFHVVSSFDKVYFSERDPRTGWEVLSDMLLEADGLCSKQEIDNLRGAPFSPSELANLTNEIADRFTTRFPNISLDSDLIRILLYLQRNEPAIDSRVRKFLRCEPFNSFDRDKIPEIGSRSEQSYVKHTLIELGKLIYACSGGALVILVDQLEEMMQGAVEKSGERFRLAITSLRTITEAVPSSVSVIACLDDFFERLSEELTRPLRDRLERDGIPPQILQKSRSDVEVRKLIENRLRELYRRCGAKFDESDALYPLPENLPRLLAGSTARDILSYCNAWRDGTLTSVDKGGRKSVEDDADQAIINLSQAWNDCSASFKKDTPDTEEALAELLNFAVTEFGHDLAPVRLFHPDREGRKIVVGVQDGNKKLQIAICNKATQGGGFGKQVKEFRKQANGFTPVVVRASEFPRTGAAFQELIALVEQDHGRRIVIQDSNWRVMMAFREFHRTHADRPHYLAWRQKGRPLAGLKPLCEVLKADLPTNDGKSVAVPSSNGNGRQREHQPPVVIPRNVPSEERSSAKTPAVVVPKTPLNTPVLAGISADLKREPINLETLDLTRHAVFLGSPGSGKTTAALNVIEQLALRGVPTIMLDRKGDLCGYATNTWHTAADDTPERAERRKQFREIADVRVYTPGKSDGRPLSIPLGGNDIAAATAESQEESARTTAAALAGMMGLTKGDTAAQLSTVLFQAVHLLNREAGGFDLPRLIEFVGNQDPALTEAIRWLDVKKVCKALVAKLQIMQISHKQLFAADCEQLDVAELLGKRNPNGKTRISIVSTKFLTDGAVDFWTAQFFSALDRWRSKAPSPELQAVLMLDEADIYLPAVKQPAPKAPLENLLRQARSAGLGLFISTQSPGNLDYKCREYLHTWFLGKITQKTALGKLKPLFEGRESLIDQLPTKKAGEFTVIRGSKPVAINGESSLLKTEQLSENQILELARPR